MVQLDPSAGPQPERNLDTAFARLLETPDGKLCWDYLRSISSHLVLGPTATAIELAYREGSRYIVAIAEMRAEAGRKAPNGTDTGRRPDADANTHPNPGAGRRPARRRSAGG